MIGAMSSSELLLVIAGPLDQGALDDAWYGSRRGTRPFVKCGCSSVVEHLLAKERVESSNLFIRLIKLIGYPRFIIYLKSIHSNNNFISVLRCLTVLRILGLKFENYFETAFVVRLVA